MKTCWFVFRFHCCPLSWVGSSAVLWTAFALSASAQSTFDLIAEAQKKLEAEDRALNRVYQQILRNRAADSDFCKKLREAQRAWLKYMELHIETKYPLRPGEVAQFVYGTLHPLDLIAERRTLIKTRTAQLKEILGEVEDEPKSEPEE